jgi:hypothetical protein
MNFADGSVMLYRGALQTRTGVRIVADYLVLMPSIDGLIVLDVGTFSVTRLFDQ